MQDPVLAVKDVNKSFGAVIAAQDLNMEVPKGAVWSLIGSNGAGKTTFVNMVTGHIKPDQGSFIFNGNNITSLSSRQITKLGIRRSFQIPQLCAELSALENLLISLSINDVNQPSFVLGGHVSHHVEKAMGILEQFNIADYCDRSIGELPAGVRKLLDIAMAISGQPEMMLLDEPTSGVAAEEKFPIMDLVMDVLSSAGVTIMFVEHDMDIVTRYSERVLAFYDGQIIANDAPDEVMLDPQVQRYVTGTAK